MAGKNNTLNNSSGMPDLNTVLTSWEVPIIANYQAQILFDGEPQNVDNKVTVRGVKQPLKPEEVNLKPEGQRAWSWFQIHIRSRYDKLFVGQKISIFGTTYKIMGQKDYEIDGYVEYHVILDFGG